MEPGHAWQWRLTTVEAAGPRVTGAADRAAGYNQERHYAAAERIRAARARLMFYIAGTFEVPGPLDLDALEAALLYFVRRHEVLRTRFHKSASGDLTCTTAAPDDVALARVDAGRLASADDTRTYLRHTFQRVDTLSGPQTVLGAVVREDSATVYFAFDHLVADIMSATIAVSDITAAYRQFAHGRHPDSPPAGSYLRFNHDQRDRNAAVDATDTRLEGWAGFRTRNGSFFPRFPLDLGVEPGRWYPPINVTNPLLDARQTDELEARCRTAGAGLFTAALAALAITTSTEEEPDVCRALVVRNERGDGEYADSVGWFVNTLPIEIPVPQRTHFADRLAQTRKAYGAARECAGVHYVRAWELLAPRENNSTRYWPHPVNMFSYLDFRKAPGAEHHAPRKAKVHLGMSGIGGILLWMFRNDTGLHLNSIHSETPEAERSNAELTRRLGETLRDFVHHP
ncbi:condensation domain-containing protein [Streptomyces sp. NPDC012794]|uniref:condensation domain-containing protein n=1 Tax=Streptomyces sp. NPDC012794 TaxID=3364850 RepID=UPI0036B14621